MVEFLDRILPGMDAEVARTVQRILTKQGMSFKLASKVTGRRQERRGQQGHHRAGRRRRGRRRVEADVVLVAIGRVPYTEGLGLEAVGVQLDNRKRVVVDAHFQTNVPGIYAIGDVIAGPMLAHKAEDEGMAVAEILAGQAGHVNYDVIPNVIYTFPEVASVGKTEEELKAAGIAYKVGKFPFTANGRAKVNKTTDGFVKILADADDRPHPRRAHHRRRGQRDDRRGGRHHGVRRLGRGPRPHLPRPPDADRGGQGSGAGRRQARHPYVTCNAPLRCRSAASARRGCVCATWLPAQPVGVASRPSCAYFKVAWCSCHAPHAVGWWDSAPGISTSGDLCTPPCDDGARRWDAIPGASGSPGACRWLRAWVGSPSS